MHVVITAEKNRRSQVCYLPYSQLAGSMSLSSTNMGPRNIPMPAPNEKAMAPIDAAVVRSLSQNQIAAIFENMF